MKDDIQRIFGLDAISLLAHIMTAHPEIEGIFFGEPMFAPSLQTRFDLSSPDQPILDKALRLRSEYKLPFWDGLMLSLFESQGTSDSILKQATFHQSSVRTFCSISAGEAVVDHIRKRVEQIPTDKMLTISSEVRLRNGSTKHIPMMDFHCPVGAYSLDLVSRVAAQFNVGEGFLVETDKSYHFYGMELLEERDLVKFLGRALLFSPIVDRAWIAHQLIEWCCALRISSRQPNGKAPTVVGFVRG